MGIGSLSPLRGKPGRLCSHDNGCGATHVNIIIEVGVLQLGSEYLYAVLLQEVNALFRRAGYARHREGRSYRRAYEVGVVKVGERVTDYHSTYTAGISRTKYGTQITWLLDTLQHNNKRLGRELKVVQGHIASMNSGYQALGTSTIGYLLVNLTRDLEEAYAVKGRKWLCTRFNCWTPEHGVNLEARLHTMLQFTTTLNDKQSRTSPFC